jgi:perosamine synthetase
MNKINELAKKYKLAVIEDACQAHGAKIEKKTIGNLGILGCFSFYPTKNMTTGEGGIITTNSKNLTKHIQLLRSHGMPKKYYHSSLGYNFRMTDIAAAIGREQLKKLNEFNRKRQSNARLYMKHLSEIKGIITPIIPKGYVHVFHQFTIRVTPQFHISRDRLIKKFNDHNIYTEVYYPVPIHKQEIYKKIGYKDILSNAEKASLEVLSLPIHPGLKKKDILKIISIFK